jgi:hypothetical protein
MPAEFLPWLDKLVNMTPTALLALAVIGLARVVSVLYREVNAYAEGRLTQANEMHQRMVSVLREVSTARARLAASLQERSGAVGGLRRTLLTYLGNELHDARHPRRPGGS